NLPWLNLSRLLRNLTFMRDHSLIAVAFMGVFFLVAQALGEVAATASLSNSESPRTSSITVPVTAGGSLTATLILPTLKSPAPAILMIPGYIPGHRPRNEEAFRTSTGEDTGTLLARYLCDQGFAVLQVPIADGPEGNEPSLSATELAERASECVGYL